MGRPDEDVRDKPDNLGDEPRGDGLDEREPSGM
jgi:hypothetical protein